MVRTRRVLSAVVASLPLLFLSYSKAFAASLIFYGKVIDTKNQPIVGASITQTYEPSYPYDGLPITTDNSGFFSIDDPFFFPGVNGNNQTIDGTITVGETPTTLAETFSPQPLKVISQPDAYPLRVANSNYPNPDVFQVHSNTAVPEPLTILGSGMVLGFSILMQRKYSQQKN